MVGWHHRLNGHVFECALGEGEGQGRLVCCSPWDHKESALFIRWPKYWIFSFSISLSNDYSGLISIRFDWFALPDSPRDSQKSFLTLQFKSISSSVISLLYGPTLTSIYDYWEKTIALTIQTFFGKIMSLLFNMLFSYSSNKQLKLKMGKYAIYSYKIIKFLE